MSEYLEGLVHLFENCERRMNAQWVQNGFRQQSSRL